MEEYVRYGTSTQLPTLVAISLFLGLGKGGVPGLATIATAATVVTAPTQIPNGMGYAVALMVPILTMIDIYAAYLHRNVLDWGTIWTLLPLSLAGMILGQYVGERYLTDGGARMLIGLILLFILALRTWKQCMTFLFPSWAIENHYSGDSEKGKESDGDDDDIIDEEAEERASPVYMPLTRRDGRNTQLEAMESGEVTNANPVTRQKNTTSRRKAPLNSTKRLAWACSVGLIGGIATILTNSMGPILNVYLLSVAELTPESYVGTRAMFFCFLNCGKLPLRVMGGSLGMPMLPLAVGLGLVSVLGVFMAKPILLSINERLFVKLELSVVAFAGLRLCYMGIMS